MKIIATAAATLFAALAFSTGTAHAEPEQPVFVSCAKETVDLTNAQVTRQSATQTPPSTTTHKGYDNPYTTGPVNYDAPNVELYVRGFEELPKGYTAAQYLQQMQEKCKTVSPYPSSSSVNLPSKIYPFPNDYVLAVFDTKGHAEVLVGPGVEIPMEKHVDEFVNAASAGNYTVATDGIRSSINYEINEVYKAKAALEQPKESAILGTPCNLQREIPAPAEKSFWASLKDGVTSGDPVAIVGSILAVVGGFAVVGFVLLFLDRRRRKQADSEVGIDSTDIIVDAEAVKREER